MKKFINEFKEFISKGNVLDMAVGIIIGSAFTAIVNSLVNDLLNPLLNIILGGFSFDNMQVAIHLPWVKDPASWPVLNFGGFLSAIITFLITAMALFLIIKLFNTVKDKTTKKKEEEPAAPTTKICPFCKSEVDIEATKCKFCISELPFDELKKED